MNVYDSGRMLDIMRPHGFHHTDDINTADVIILNTCTIREKAAEKVYSELGRILILKNERTKLGKETVIVIAGCVAQAEGKEVIRRAPFVDIVVGPQSYHNLPMLLEQIKRNKSWIVKLDFEENNKFDLLPEELGKGSSISFLSIQEGCDKFCHFCVVPYTRGAEFSRPVSNIYREALIMAKNGVKEIILLGQNVSAYRGLPPDIVEDHDIDHKIHKDLKNQENNTIIISDIQKNHKKNDNFNYWSLSKLIENIANIKEIKRIGYTTSHPIDMLNDINLIFLHCTEKKLMPYLHLPVQSGSNKILKSMNRKHTREEYFQIINLFRKYRPDIALSSDFIVGYPGETDDDFADTIDLVKQIEYSQAFSFKYSARPGTPASEINNQIDEKIKDQRLQILQELLRKQQMIFNLQKIGDEMEVIFEKPGKKNGQVIGKSPYMQSVVCDGSLDIIGEIMNVKIVDAKQNSLFGKII